MSTGVWKTTVYDNFTTGGILTTGETICYNGNPAIIGSSVVASGGDGSISYQWQSSTTSGSSGFGNIPGATGASYGPPSGLSQSTWYRREAKDGTCNPALTASTGVWKTTVHGNFTAGGILATGETICYNGDPGNIASSVVASGGDGSIAYQWQSSTTSQSDGFGDIYGATGASYGPPAGLTQSTWYRRQAKDGTCNPTFTVSTGVWKTTVYGNFTTGGILATGETICYNGNPAIIGSSVAASGGNGAISYQWQSSTVDQSTGFGDISGATGASFDPPGGLTQTTWYRRMAKDGLCNTVLTLSAGVWKTTVYGNFTTGGILTTGETVCHGGDPANIGSSVVASGGDGSIAYQWQSSTASQSTGFGNISGATGASFDPPSGLTQTTWYRRMAKDGTCNPAFAPSDGVWKTTVYGNFTAGGIVATGETVCFGGNPAAIGSSVDAGGGDGAIVYQWQSSTISQSTGFGDIPGATGASYGPPAGLTQSTWYRRQAKDGTCNTAFTLSAGTALITVKAHLTATLSGGATYCNGAATTTTLSLAVTGSGTVSGTLSEGTPFTGTAPVITVDVAPTSTTAYTIATLTDGACNAVPADMGGSATVTVNPLPVAPAAGNVTVCHDGSAHTGTATAGAGETVIWYTMATGGAVTTAPSGTAAGSYVAYAAAKVAATGCESATRTSVTVKINALPAAAAGADRIACGGSSTTLGAAAVPGSTYSWSSAPSGFASTLANPTAAPTVSTTYTVVETVALTGCTNSHSVVVTTKPIPAAVAGDDRTICYGTSTVIGAPPVPGNIYKWTSMPPLLTSTKANPTVSPLINTVYTLVETIYATGCSNTHSVTVTVAHAVGAAGAISGPATVLQGQAGVTFSVAPIANATGYAWSLPSGAAVTAGGNTASITVSFSATAVSGTVTVAGTNVCGSGAASPGFSLTVTPLIPVDLAVDGTVSTVACYNASQTITVAGSGSFIVKAAATVTMIAGQNIIYLPGATVEPNGYMHGYISSTDHCPSQLPSIVTITTGEDELPLVSQTPSFKLWPNPTTGNFTLEQTGGQPNGALKVAIYGMHGEKLLSRELTGEKKYVLSISEFPVGLYFVKVVAGEGAATFKLIKTN